MSPEEAEIERLRAENSGLSKAVIDIQEERDLAQAEFQTYHTAWGEQQAELARVAHLRETEIDQAGAAERIYVEAARLKDARIQALENALVEERAKYNLSWKDCAYRAPDTYCEKTHNYCTSEDCPLLDEQKTEARRQLRAEGKIGPDASKPRSWRITDERKAAVEHLIAVGCGYGGTCGAISILRTMLTEAGQ